MTDPARIARDVVKTSTGHVVVSTVDLDKRMQLVSGMDAITLARHHMPCDGLETLVFPSDADGNVTDYTELDGDKYNTAEEASAGHVAMVEKWSRR